MYNTNKSFSIMSLAFGLVVFFFTVFTSLVVADENYGNVPLDANMMMSMSMSQESVTLPFDPNDYTFLVYNPGGGEASIEDAMEKLGIPYDERGYVNGVIVEVTPNDLATHDILIVGWNNSGDTSGLHSDDLAAGITGRVILSGHDLDYHTATDPQPKEAAQTMLVQAIDWVLKGGGTGMITLGCTGAFPYLPGVWGVEPNVNAGEDVSEFTTYGLFSGVYDGLEPIQMCNWGRSYHDVFTIEQGPSFIPFERGGNTGNDIITIASNKFKFPYFYIYKDDNDVNCVCPYNCINENYLYYQICYDANGHTDTNVVITDYLPPEVDYYSSNPVGTYHSDTNTVTWNIGTLSGCIQLTVMVTNYARPGSIITNVVEMEGDSYYTEAVEDTNVCCYGGEIIYVDRDANGFNNGTSWDDAYTDLQDALTGARNCGAAVTAIWVAAGTYKPTQNPGDNDANFALIEDVGLFGHFGGVGTYETSPDQRNFTDANNETILDGQIGDEQNEAVQYVVTSNGVKNALVDGFTVTGSYGSYGAGIFLNDSNAAIVNCKLKENYGYSPFGGHGIDITNYSHPYIQNCFFIDNSTVGIWCDGSSPVITNTVFDGNNITLGGVAGYNSSFITLSNCTAKNHIASGIYGQQTDIDIENCCVTDNGYGIYCEYNCNPTINNSVIKGNDYYGVYCSDSDLITSYCVIENNDGPGLWCVADSLVDLTNSIIRWNRYDGIHLEDMSFTTIKNNWIHNNGTMQSAYGAGICFNNQYSIPLVRNNTIYDNFTYGIESSEYSADPNISNCIIYGNGIEDLSWAGTVNYCCLQSTHSGTGNIYGDPGFMNPDDPNDLHIDEDSPCKDAGDPAFVPDSGETDIDGEGRVKYGRVDIGGDEYYWSPADFNNPDSRDGLVNFIDYAIFANAWDSNTSDSDWNHDYDLAADGVINYYDLDLFCEDWLWQAGWTKTFTCGAGKGMIQTMAAGFAPAEALYPAVLAEQQIEKVEPLKIEQLIKWLEELWLDEETQKVIDKDIWLKFIESLKEEL